MLDGWFFQSRLFERTATAVKSDMIQLKKQHSVENKCGSSKDIATLNFEFSTCVQINLVARRRA